MKKLFILLVATGVLLSNQSAQAGLLIEPYLGYTNGEAKQGSTTNDYKGTQYGLRLGYSVVFFALGLDYTGAKYTDDSNPSNDLEIGDVGLFLAYKFPVLFRAYATYVPSAKMDYGTSTKLEGATTTKLGLGFTGFPIVNVNLEYQMGTYKEADSVTLVNKIETTSYALVLSAPFVF